MNRRSSFKAAAIAVAAFCIFFGRWEAHAEDYGVLITPSDPATSAGSKAAADAWKLDARINETIPIDTAQDFFDAARRLKAEGKKVDLLVINGEGATNAPGIWFKPNPADGEYLDWESLNRANGSGGFQGFMSKDGTIFLSACSTTCDDAHRQFAENLGRALLPEGGYLIGSTGRIASIPVSFPLAGVGAAVATLIGKERIEVPEFIKPGTGPIEHLSSAANQWGNWDPIQIPPTQSPGGSEKLKDAQPKPVVIKDTKIVPKPGGSPQSSTGGPRWPLGPGGIADPLPGNLPLGPLQGPWGVAPLGAPLPPPGRTPPTDTGPAQPGPATQSNPSGGALPPRPVTEVLEVCNRVAGKLTGCSPVRAGACAPGTEGPNCPKWMTSGTHALCDYPDDMAAHLGKGQCQSANCTYGGKPFRVDCTPVGAAPATRVAGPPPATGARSVVLPVEPARRPAPLPTPRLPAFQPPPSAPQVSSYAPPPPRPQITISLANPLPPVVRGPHGQSALPPVVRGPHGQSALPPVVRGPHGQSALPPVAKGPHGQNPPSLVKGPQVASLPRPVGPVVPATRWTPATAKPAMATGSRTPHLSRPVSTYRPVVTARPTPAFRRPAATYRPVVTARPTPAVRRPAASYRPVTTARPVRTIARPAASYRPLTTARAQAPMRRH